MAEGGLERRKKGAPFLTVDNIMTTLTGIESKWDSLGTWLCVPHETRKSIREQHSTDLNRLRELLLYMLNLHPFASWRLIINALYKIREDQLAERLQEYAEPETDSSLTVKNVADILNRMQKSWYGFTSLSGHLDVSESKSKEIKQHQSRTQQHIAFASYCVSTLHGFSWARFAGTLYYCEEEDALVAAKRYCEKEKDPTFTPSNVLTLLENEIDWKWLGAWMDVPYSKRDEMTDKEPMIEEWLENHPAPSWEVLAWALYRRGDGRIYEHSTLKQLYEKYITAPDIKRKLNACQQAIAERGAFEQIAMQGIFIGHPRSGKTTSKKRLVGKKPEVNQASTRVAEKITRIEIDKSTVYSSWKEVTELNEETAIIVGDVVDCVSTKIYRNSVQSTVSHIHEQDKIMYPSESRFENPILACLRRAFAMILIGQMSISVERVEHKINQPGDGSSTVEILITALQRAPNHLYWQRRWTLYLSDVGGQPEFQEMLPSLVSGPSLYFLTFPLHKGLNERYLVEYQHPTKGSTVSFESTSTNKELLLQSLSSITSTRSYTKTLTGKSVSPKILLLGTHRDELQSEEQLQEIDQELQNVIEKTSAFKEDMIVFCSESQMIFALDNTSDDDADVQQVRDAVGRLAMSTDDYRIQTPCTWMLFAVTLRHLPERVLSIEKCLEVGKECGIDTKDELNNALWFLHHNVGIIRHFQEHRELQNVVIKEPQYIFDKVTELIVNTFTFRNVGAHLQREFIRKGIFPASTVQMLSTDSDTLTGDKFATLLEHHHIIAPIEEDGKVVKYFAPCALAHAELPPDTAESKQIIPPLLVVFESGYCPKGLFGALVVNLLKKSKGSEFKWTLKEDRIYRDQICLSVGPYDSFQFFMSPISVKIALYTTIERNRKITLGRICCHVRREIDESIRAVIYVLHYTEKATHTFAFSCPGPAPHEESHAATINFSPEGEACTLTCPFSREVHAFSDDTHNIWFDENMFLQEKTEDNSATSVQCKTSDEALNNIPTMSELTSFSCCNGSCVNIAVEVSTSYFDFGAQLLDDPSGARLKNIERAKLRDPKEINTEILTEWLKGGERLPVTWSALAKALADIRKGELAEQIRKMKLLN